VYPCLVATPDLSVVLLCYRAEEGARTSVQKIIELLEPVVPNYELVLVANYLRTTDTTPEVVASLAQQNPRVKYTAVPKEGMMGWDMKSGLSLATGRYVAVTDGDGQMPYEDIVRVYKTALETGADMVKTYRTVRGDDTWRIIVSFIYNLLFSILFPGMKTRDANSKPKLFTREALSKLTLESNDWFIDAEIMIQARRNRFTIVEIPTTFSKLVGRQSFVKTATIFEFLRNLVYYRWKEFFV
jgi:glycosyltransferase involved in cell wall biosynthesis